MLRNLKPGPTVGVLFSFFGLVVLIVAFFPSQEADIKNDARAAKLLTRDCDFHYAKHMKVRCYYYRTHDVGGFYLPLALISQTHRRPIGERDLLVHIPGGPGQGFMTTGEEIAYWVERMQTHHWQFDLLLFDPRGTGEGKHAWRCRDYHRLSQQLLGENIAVAAEYRQLHDVAAKCFTEFERMTRRRLATERYPRRASTAYATIEQAQDIAGMAMALGYTRVHLWGVSYGTRLALAAAKQEVVKSLILDSPYPFARGHYSELPQLYHQSFTSHAELFGKLFPASAQGFGDIYQGARARLAQKPLLTRAHHIATDTHLPFVLTDTRLLELSFSVLYKPYLYRSFYLGLREFANERRVNEDLQLVIDSFISNVLDEGFSYMVYFAIECLDNRPQAEGEILQALQAYPDLADYFRAGWEYDVCRVFDFAQRKYVQALAYSDKPTLIFSGEYDPITPAAWGAELAQRLPRARHIVIANEGHGVLFSSQCNWSFVQNFVAGRDTGIAIECRGDAY